MSMAVTALALACTAGAAPQGNRPEHTVSVTPLPYDRALRNPLKGFTTLGARSDHEWATLAHHYIRWNEIENDETDGIEKIRAFCDSAWKDLPGKNIKVIPRVYLHWSGDDRKYWPADMQADDYESPQFQRRLVGLVEKLGIVWNDDPRVAFVELGIFGKWGEHHSPSPSPDMQRIAGEAFRAALPSKIVSVRHAWSEFTGFGFGEYWDSWAHYQQMWAHGQPIRDLNAATGLWRTAYIGGETAYDWGMWKTQPGDDATDSVSDPVHRDFVINSVRWLHATQLRWIGNYDARNPEARAGAEHLQKALGYRFVIDAVRFSPRIDAPGTLRVELDVRNTGSAPFYYRWPLVAALLDPQTLRPCWQGPFPDADIRTWLPGDGWTDPEWIAIEPWPQKAPKAHWSDADPAWAVPPIAYTETAEFEISAPPGTYVLAVAVADPAGMLPAVRFASANYLNGGWHPVGLVSAAAEGGGPLPAGFPMDDPGSDTSLHYVP